MLKTVDILLGITVVMLVASMAVTVLIQFVTGLRNARGKYLALGLTDLLQEIHPRLEQSVANSITHAVLKHPLIAGMSVRLPIIGEVRRLGTTIHREEFTQMLMYLAISPAANSGFDKKDDGTLLDRNAQEALKKLLKENGIDNPEQTLDAIRAAALELEKTKPELATNVRHGMAVISAAQSKLVAKINGWFDQTIDRVSERFTADTRSITVLCSILVVGAIQLDTLDVINRLSVDDGVRSALVAQAFTLQPKAGETGGAGGQEADLVAVKTKLKSLQELGVVNIWGSNTGWCERWKQLNPFGVVLSVFLLSLGAPFWYATLQNLLKLRGALAVKDDAQRKDRQSQSTAEST